jgi:hypothetical protein
VPLSVLSAIKKIIVVKAAFLCLAHALVIAMAQVNIHPNYELYRHSICLNKTVDNLLNVSGFDLSNGGSLEELWQFQEYLSDYKIVVLDGLIPDRDIFSGKSLSAKKLYLLYDRDCGNYNVITNVEAAMAKKYMYNGCDTLYDNTYKCDKTCYMWTATPPSTKDQSKYCATCNRYFLNEKCFQDHPSLKLKGKLVC